MINQTDIQLAPSTANLQECDCCGDEFPIKQMELVNLQMLCEGCKQDFPVRYCNKSDQYRS